MLEAAKLTVTDHQIGHYWSLRIDLNRKKNR